jgi:hypothetical protein
LARSSQIFITKKYSRENRISLSLIKNLDKLRCRGNNAKTFRSFCPEKNFH